MHELAAPRFAHRMMTHHRWAPPRLRVCECTVDGGGRPPPHKRSCWRKVGTLGRGAGAGRDKETRGRRRRGNGPCLKVENAADELHRGCFELLAEHARRRRERCQRWRRLQ